LLPPNGLAAAWQGLSLQLLAGSAWAVHADRLPRPPVPRFDREHDRAAALLRLALAAALAGEAVDAALALPLYLRDKVAQTTLERDSARGARVAATAGAAP
jgi:tRNA threonylcarbamoyladenosine biosynthesis protein TsaB